MFCFVHVVQKLRGQLSDLAVVGSAWVFQVVHHKSDIVSQGPVEPIFNFVLSPGLVLIYRPMYFWMTHHFVPTWSCISYSFWSSSSSHSLLLSSGSRKLIHFSLHSISVRLNWCCWKAYAIFFHFFEVWRGYISVSKLSSCLVFGVPLVTISIFFVFFTSNNR